MAATKQKQRKTTRRRGRLSLVIGGASSGKSQFALELVKHDIKRAFVATGQPLDDEMAERIRRHQSSRGPDWETAEVPLELTQWFLSEGSSYDSIVLDCLTLWLSNLRERDVSDDQVPALVTALIEAIQKTSAHIVVVTNELGLGLVPQDALIRRFRELAGRVNQQFAQAADDVYFIVSGLPIQMKPTKK